MRKIILVVLGAVLILAACSSGKKEIPSSCEQVYRYPEAEDMPLRTKRHNRW